MHLSFHGAATVGGERTFLLGTLRNAADTPQRRRRAIPCQAAEAVVLNHLVGARGAAGVAR